MQKRFPAFRRKGRFLLLGEIEYLVRGLVFDASAFSKTDFYPTVFVQALYKPEDGFIFTFGGRLRAPGQLVWDTAQDPPDLLLEGMTEAINEQVMPFLDRFHQPIDLALACEAPPDERFTWPTDDIHVLETGAYSWLLAGNARKSLERLERILRQLQHDPDDRDWVQELGGRAAMFLDWLRRGDESSARRQLLQWADETAKALHLEQFRKTTGSVRISATGTSK